MHWADAFLEGVDGDQVISTGISPSGPIHVGNMREILTGDIIYRASSLKKLKARFIYLCDDIDPLRKVYPFLDPGYSEHVGKPLYKMPSPDGNGTYADHYLSPFLGSLEKLHINVEVIRSSDLYATGKLYKTIKNVIEEREKIAKILEEVSGRSVGRDWYPYNPLCRKCGRINQASVVSFEDPYVHYECKCGHSGKSDIRKDQGKMPWRVEWPAKWHVLGVSIEPMGKDHGAAGGAYESGKRIVEEILGTSAPRILIYERIMLKGKGAMHSSSGIVVEAGEALKFMPEEAMRFFIVKNNPAKHLDFDPALGILYLIDDYEKYFNAYFGKDRVTDDDMQAVVKYSSLDSPVGPVDPSFRHLVTVVQIYSDETRLLRALKSSGSMIDSIDDNLRSRISKVRYWLSKYAPESVKFSILPSGTVVELSDNEIRILRRFLETSEDLDWEPQTIHDSIYSLSAQTGVDASDVFRTFYRVLIGKDRGPRLGFFLSGMDRKWALERLRECTQAARP